MPQVFLLRLARCGNENTFLSECSSIHHSAVPASADDKRSLCLIAPTQAKRDQAASYFKAKGLLIDTVEATKADTTSVDKVFFSTMHRAKGLEFDRVIVLSNKLGDLEFKQAADQRRLIYVAITRAKREANLIFL